jgi:CheY-like chemotaxis protein/anti-sigma regulatory factor (Ser/Thr protein kinase)
VKLAAPKWKTQSISLGKTINIALELERVPPVMGNEAELREVITNLVFNAVDALPKGGVITLRTRPDTRMVQFEVVDNGIGMSPEVRNRCLEPFFTTKGDRGTGLGLPMVFGIIKRHEGLLNIQSVPGEGTTLMIRLPVADEIGMRVETVERPTLMHSLSVLVVDNEPAVRDIVSRYLAADGHRVTTASSGAEAVQRFQGSDFDLLLTDHGMPGMTGLQLARFIRQMRANQPIVLLTGFTFDSDRLPPEINRVIRKPIAPEKLRAVLAEVVRSGQRAVAA